ncbi:MAG: bifunctional serine/threonine-protein kinase/formylglycine-generating enzyme family protein, partial [Planctomycetota bacterium]|nr:bifunctional serine/threonine-protein kinase/formylglycine-generating enzyme family protein [Planctomycetota bacterium]
EKARQQLGLPAPTPAPYIIDIVSDDPSGTGTVVGNKKELRTFGDYLIEGELGHGAMGVVYKARHKDSGDVVALKVLLRSHQAKPKSLERFKREMVALREVSHRNVVRLREWGEVDGKPYLVIDYIHGQTFRSYYNFKNSQSSSRLSLGKVIELFTGLAEALEACHEKQLVHRDLKPTNILIEGKTERPVLIDFGLVRRDAEKLDDLLEGLNGTLTQTGEIVGSPAFMAPEQMRLKTNFGDVGTHSDVWGFGGTLFYALTGKAPFEGMAKTPIELVFCLMNRQVPRVRTLRPEIPAWLDKLLTQCLNKNSAARPTMTEIVQTLKTNKDNLERPALAPRIFAGVAALALLLCLPFLFVLFSPKDLALVQLSAPSHTSKEKLKLTLIFNQQASLKLESFSVSQDSYEIETDESGRLVWMVTLNEGPNKFRVRSLTQEFDQIIEIVRDSEDPKILIENGSENLLIVPNTEKAVQGTARDQSPVEVFVNGQQLALKAGGRFTYPIPELKGLVEYKVECRDKAGNSHSFILPVLTEAYAKQLSRECLNSTSLWSRASEKERWVVSLIVLRELGSGFQFLTMDEFRCADQRFQLPSYKHKRSGIVFRLVPGGEYIMGSDRGQVWEKPVHKVRVKPFLIGIYEVSQKEWDGLEGKDQRKFKGENRPIEMVNWIEARKWLDKAGSGLRLPSEAEWEYAARACTKTDYFWGMSVKERYCWFKLNSGSKTHDRSPFQSKTRMNAFGLEDMLGNVWEWCEDSWIASYNSGPKSEKARRRKDIKEKTIRGGSWYNMANDLRVSHRYAWPPTKRFGNLGFRAVRGLDFSE